MFFFLIFSKYIFILTLAKGIHCGTANTTGPVDPRLCLNENHDSSFDEDFGVNNYVSVSGTNKDGDIRITSRQSFAVRDGEEITDVFSNTQNLVISREDAKRLIQQLVSHL